MISKGFRFGMLLQFAVGPICLFIFQTSVSSGLFIALLGVLGVTVVDGVFILAAILGMGTLLGKSENTKKAIKLFGGFILILFGLSTSLSVMGVNFIPGLNLTGVQTVDNVFMKTLLLTLSNPLTILFWAGVFSSKMIEENMEKLHMYQFGLGAILSTILFLSFVSVVGNYLNVFIEGSFMNMLNVIVGIILIGFGVRSLIK